MGSNSMNTESKFNRRDFLKLAGVGLGALAFRPFNFNKIEDKNSVADTPLYLDSVNVSTYPAHTNMLLGFTRNQSGEAMVHVSILKSFPSTTVLPDGKHVIKADLIPLNDMGDTGTGIIDATKLYQVSVNDPLFKEAESKVDYRFEADIRLGPECFVTESSDNEKYDELVEVSRQKMFEEYGSDSIPGTMVLDLVSGTVSGKHVRLFDEKAEIIKSVWVSTLNPETSLPVDILYSEPQNGVSRRGRSRITLVAGQASPFPETLDDSPTHIETQYKTTLTVDQITMLDSTQDRTSEGLVRRFLDGDLSSYLAYVDVKPDSKDLGEVVGVWNREQQKSNPALLIENNLFVNENSASEIIWNPDMDRAEAKQTMADYMKYVRAQVCAKSNKVDLPNTLDGALADPNAIKYLEDGCTITLLKSSGGKNHPYNVPEQNILISSETGVVIRFVSEPNSDMTFIESGVEKASYHGWSFKQQDANLLSIDFFQTGAPYITQFPEYTHLLFSERLAYIFQSLFSRTQQSNINAGERDTVTGQIIYGTQTNYPDEPQALIIYSKTR